VPHSIKDLTAARLDFGHTTLEIGTPQSDSPFIRNIIRALPTHCLTIAGAIRCLGIMKTTSVEKSHPSEHTIEMLIFCATLQAHCDRRVKPFFNFCKNSPLETLERARQLFRKQRHELSEIATKTIRDALRQQKEGQIDDPHVLPRQDQLAMHKGMPVIVGLVGQNFYQEISPEAGNNALIQLTIVGLRFNIRRFAETYSTTFREVKDNFEYQTHPGIVKYEQSYTYTPDGIIKHGYLMALANSFINLKAETGTLQLQVVNPHQIKYDPN